MGVPNPVTNKLELHNTWLVCIFDFFVSCKAFADPLKADVLKNYISWAVEQKFGIIDINIPKHLTGIDVSFKLSLHGRNRRMKKQRRNEISNFEAHTMIRKAMSILKRTSWRERQPLKS